MARSDQDDDETYYFPSQAWFDEYRDPINADDEYAEVAANWGTEFDGDFVFGMEDMPVEAPDTGAVPDSLAAELDRYVGRRETATPPTPTWDWKPSSATAAHLVERPERVNAGFTLSATPTAGSDCSAANWASSTGLVTGRFDIDGDRQKMLQYSRAAVRPTETTAGIDAEFAGEVFADP